jgi:hypothetical protein
MKPIPPGLSFKEALSLGYAAVRSEDYQRLVRALPCCACNAPAPSDPHHPHGVGYRGAGTKCPDIWVIPLCRRCHDALHKDRVAWEGEYGTQFEFVAVTYVQLWTSGAITLGGVTAAGEPTAA